MEGWNDGRGSSWSYHDEIGSNVSSFSGTIVSDLSTANASSGSRFSMEAAIHLDSLGINDGNKTFGWEAAEDDHMDLIRSLVLEFFGAPSANFSVKRGNMSAVERWIKEMGVDWLFNLEDGASAGKEPSHDMWISCWISALDQVTHTLCFRSQLFPDSDCGSKGLPGICEEEGELLAENSGPDQYHLVLFIKETILKILTFVDVVVAWYPDTMKYSSLDQVMNTKLVDLLKVHDALSETSNKIVTLFDSPASVEVERIENEMAILLSAYKSKVTEVIRSTMEKIRMISMEDGDDSPSPLDPQGSSEIHKVTMCITTYISFLKCRSQSLNQVMQGHVPCTENMRPLDNMIGKMVFSLQEKLVSISESFPDQALRLLFLLNNSYHIQWWLEVYDLRGPELLDVDIEHKVKVYMERYLQVSWAPLLSCLCNSTLLCLGKNCPLLSKFESELQKIYTTQKQWKVPDPRLRRRLRQAITDKIVPGYTEYIEDNKVTNQKFSPQKLKAKLQELFEG